LGVPISERRTTATFKTARTDLLESVGLVKGLWARLDYAARLRDQNGEYAHWGLMRCHGADTAQSAMREVHESVYAELLRTPISRSLRELTISATSMGQKSKDYIARFETGGFGYVPSSMLRGTQRHFATLVGGLRSLLQADEHPDA